jgi:solute carrier family 25 phosphate transporter 23/24/25/41
MIVSICFETYFRFVSVNGDKILQTAELKQALREFRIPDENLSRFYIPSDHSMDYAEFRELILLHDDAMRSTFEELSQGEPVISFDHFRDGLRKNSPIAQHLDDPTLRKLFNRIDTNRNSAINYAEFVAAIYILPEISVDEAMKQFERSQWFHVNEMTTLSNPAPISFLRTSIDWNAALQTLISGGIAGGVSRTVTAPLDRLKYMRQVGRSTGIIDGSQKVYAEGGLKSFFRGNGVNVSKVIPGVVLF